MTGPRVDDRITRERTVREALRRFRLELQQEVRTNTASSGVGDIRGPASSTDTAVPRFVGSGGKTLQNSGVLINATNDITGVNSLTVSTSLNSQTLAVGVVALNAAGDFTGIRSLTMSSGLNVGVSPDALATELVRIGGDLLLGGYLQVIADEAQFLDALFGGTSHYYARMANSGGNLSWGVGHNTPGTFFATSVANAGFISSQEDLEFIRAGTLRLAATATGVEIFGGLFLDGNAVGDVSGPAGAGDDAVPVFEGATGKLLRSSSVSISSIGHLTAPALTITGVSTFTGNMTTGAITASGVNIGGATGDATSILDLIGDLAISGRIRTYQDSGELFGTVTPIIPPGADIYVRIGDVTNEFYLGIGKDSPDGTGFLRGTVGHAAVLHSASADIELIRSNTKRLWVTSAGVQVAGTLLVNGSPVGTGSGDVVGPASGTDNAIVRFDGATGKLVQDSSVLITDGGTIFSDAIWIGSGFDVLSGEIVKIGTGGLQVADTVSIVTSTGDALVMTQFSTSHLYASLNNSGGDLFIGVGNVTPGTGFATSVAYAAFIDAANDIELIRAGTKRLGVTSAGVEVTGTLLVNGVAVSTGDVTGPASANNNSLVRFDGSTGKIIKAGGPIVSDTGAITGVSSLTMTGALTGATTGAFSSNVTIGGTLGVTGLTTFTGGFKLANAAWLRWRNAANTLDYDVMRVTAGNAVVINAPPSSSIIQQLNGVDAATLDAAGLHLIGALSLAGAVTGVTTLAASGTVTANGGFVNTQSGFTTVLASDVTGSYIEAQGVTNPLRFFAGGTGPVMTIGAGDVGIGLHPVGANRLLAVGSTSRATTYIRVVSQAAGVAWFEALASGGISALFGVNNSGVTVQAIPSGSTGIVYEGDFVLASVAGFERLHLTNAGVLKIPSLAGSGTRIVGADSTGNLVITALGSGDVVGPTSAVSGGLASYDGTTGKRLADSGVSVISGNVLRAGGFGIAGGGGTTTLGIDFDEVVGEWQLQFSGGILVDADLIA